MGPLREMDNLRAEVEILQNEPRASCNTRKQDKEKKKN